MWLKNSLFVLKSCCINFPRHNLHHLQYFLLVHVSFLKCIKHSITPTILDNLLSFTFGWLARFSVTDFPSSFFSLFSKYLSTGQKNWFLTNTFSFTKLDWNFLFNLKKLDLDSIHNTYFIVNCLDYSPILPKLDGVGIFLLLLVVTLIHLALPIHTLEK